MLNVYIDADACPVKEDAFRVAKRYGLKVFAVSNVPIHLPKETWIEPVVVGKAFDAVDDWLALHVSSDDIVITNDLLLANRCLQKGARVIDPRGRVLTEDNIGEALALRELMSDLRQSGAMNLGPKKMGKNHRSQFLSSLDELIHAIRKKHEINP